MILKGKTAAITGASRGLGAAFAERFAREGAAVSLAARDEARLATVAARIESAGGVALVTPTDVTSSGQVGEYASRTLERFGNVDVLVNNAGALIFGTLLEQDDDDWNAMLDANLNSARLVTRAFLPSMLEHGSGKVIFISSNAAKRGFPGHVGYAVAKAGLMALNRSVAVEYGTRGIHSFCVNPGLVADTDMGRDTVAAGVEAFGSPEAYWEWANSLSPTGYHPSIEEIVDLVTFLASDRSTVLHGMSLTADHGFTPY